MGWIWDEEERKRKGFLMQEEKDIEMYSEDI